MILGPGEGGWASPVLFCHIFTEAMLIVMDDLIWSCLDPFGIFSALILGSEFWSRIGIPGNGR